MVHGTRHNNTRFTYARIRVCISAGVRFAICADTCRGVCGYFSADARHRKPRSRRGPGTRARNYDGLRRGARPGLCTRKPDRVRACGALENIIENVHRTKRCV